MHIKLSDISVRFPIYDAKNRSFKHSILQAATGGTIVKSAKFTEIEALKNIRLNIQEGERVALLGHNGSGKTTMLRVITGAYTPVLGHISVVGKITSLLDAMIGMDAEATGIENIYLRGLLFDLKPKLIKKLTEDIVEFSELGDFIDLPVRTYSSGMVLRLAFAISTSIPPEILIMDEWISVGDDAYRQKAELRLNEFVKEAGILVMATHDHEMAKRTCKRIITLNHGSVVSDRPIMDSN